MTRISGRWLGVGIAVLVVAAFAFMAMNGGSSQRPQASVTPLYADGSTTVTAEQPAQPATVSVPGISIGAAGGLILKFGIVAAILAASLWAMRRFTGAGARSSGRTSAITIADTIMLAQGRALYVVDVGDRAVLVGATPQQFSTLADITDAALLEKLRTQPEKPTLALNNITARLETAVRGFNNARLAAQTARAARVEQATTEPHLTTRHAPATFAEALDAVDEAPDFTLTTPPDADEAPTSRLRRVRDERREETTVPAMMDAAPPETTERLRALAERLRAARESA